MSVEGNCIETKPGPFSEDWSILPTHRMGNKFDRPPASKILMKSRQMNPLLF